MRIIFSAGSDGIRDDNDDDNDSFVNNGKVNEGVNTDGKVNKSSTDLKVEITGVGGPDNLQPGKK